MVTGSIARDLRLLAKYHLVRRAETYPAPETELGVELLGYDWADYARWMEQPPARFGATELARFYYQDVGYPVFRLESEAEPDAKRLLVLAGVHGNEQAGLLGAQRIVERWYEDLPDEITRAVLLTVITPVNPVGAAATSRYNAEGYDINRDFDRFLTPEARMVRKQWQRARPDLVVSLHEGPQAETFLFANRFIPRPLAREVLGALRESGAALAEKDYFGKALVEPGYAPATPVGWGLQKVWGLALGMATTGMYADEQGIGEITLESSWRHPSRDTRVTVHVALVQAVATWLAALER